MSNFIKKYRFLIARRITQVTIMFLYLSANVWGWKILMGNLSSSKLFESIPLSDPFATLQIIFAGGIFAIDLIVGAIIITFFYAIVGGRGFCAFVCPLNMVTDLANYLRRKFDFDKVGHKVWLDRRVRYIVIILTLALSTIFGIGAFEVISPIGVLHRGIIFGFGFGFALIIAIFLFDFLVAKHGWCGYICPLGGFYSLISNYSLFRVKYDKEKCTECMNCKNICPEKEVLHMVTKEGGYVTMGECILCGRCIEVCNDDALNFSIRDFLKDKR